MAIIYTPNPQYNGTSAGVSFLKGVGESNDPKALAWLQEHGYQVSVQDETEETEQVESDVPTQDELEDTEQVESDVPTQDELEDTEQVEPQPTPDTEKKPARRQPRGKRNG